MPLSSVRKRSFFFIFSILLCSLFIISPLRLDIIDNTLLVKNIEDSVIKNSNYYNLTGSSIFIDDSDPNYNWSITEAENDWCSGSGTWNDPFIIENVTIDAQNPFNNETVILDYKNLFLNMSKNSTSCITIQNSNVNFIIRNCTFCNSGVRMVDCGIKLINVNNSQIINNSLISNSYGIYVPAMSNNTYLPPSSNNTISYNIIKKGAVGILSYISYHSTFSKNTIHNNFCGILAMGLNNTISLNSLVSNGVGIGSFGCFRQKILKNNLTHNIDGIQLLYSFNSTIFENTIKNNKGNGIFMQSSHYNNISNNECTSNRINGIHLQGQLLWDPFTGPEPVQDCDYNWILENILNNNSNGILLNYTIHNQIINNRIENNRFSGIQLNHSDNIEIIYNRIKENYYGIILEESNLNEIIQNTINYSHYGINLKESDWNNIIQNTINHNYYGIYVSSSHWNDIIENTLHYNRICYIEDGYCVNNNYEDNDCIETAINETNWFQVFSLVSLIGLAILLFIYVGLKRAGKGSKN